MAGQVKMESGHKPQSTNSLLKTLPKTKQKKIKTNNLRAGLAHFEVSSSWVLKVKFKVTSSTSPVNLLRPGMARLLTLIRPKFCPKNVIFEQSGHVDRPFTAFSRMQN